MPQLIINHSNKISNAHALDAVQRFIHDNYRRRHADGYQTERAVTLHSVPLSLVVNELPHENEDDSPASAVFTVRKLDEPPLK